MKKNLIILIIVLIIIVCSFFYFKFSSSENSFECPEVTGINCEPFTDNPYCEYDYMNWIKDNCPNIRISE
jgi:uncharacterized protein YxeA